MMSNIEKLRELEAKATKGDWYQRGPLTEEEACRAGGLPVTIIVCDPVESSVNHDILDDVREKDVEFIVAARNALPALLRIAEAAEIVTEQHPLCWCEPKGSRCEGCKLKDALAALEELKL